MRGLSLVGEHYLTRSVPFSSLLCLRCRETLGVTMSVTHTDKPSPLLWTSLSRRFGEEHVMRVVRRSSQATTPTRAKTSHRPYYGRARQGVPIHFMAES